MSARKPLHPDCSGSITCPVPDHTSTKVGTHGRFRLRHTPLTIGQRKTLRERRRATERGEQS